MNTQLRLSSTNRMVGGVAGGLAETYNWDPTLVRVGFVALALFNGIGLLLYGALWLVMRYGIASSMNTGSTGTELGPVSDRNRMLGLALIAVGMLVLASIFDIGMPMMAVLLIGGGWYLMRRS